LYEALNYEIPIFGHLPLLLNPNKSKMSKRDTSDVFVTVKKFAQEGFLSEAVVNFIALL
jgi:glutamyl/glutaminyl-tRNA synthetase